MNFKTKICKYCGKEFRAFSPLQQVCDYRCAMKLVKTKKKTKLQKMRKQAGLENDRLRKKADALFQEVCKKLYPKSAIDNAPTEVIHHYIYKSDSHNTRYDTDNAVPLTVDQHYNIHNGKHKGTLNAQASIWLGEKLQRLEQKSRITCKLSDEYLEEVIERLESQLSRLALARLAEE